MGAARVRLPRPHLTVKDKPAPPGAGALLDREPPGPWSPSPAGRPPKAGDQPTGPRGRGLRSKNPFDHISDRRVEMAEPKKTSAAQAAGANDRWYDRGKQVMVARALVDMLEDADAAEVPPLRWTANLIGRS